MNSDPTPNPPLTQGFNRATVIFCAVDKIGFFFLIGVSPFKHCFVGTTRIYHEDALSFGDRKLPFTSLEHGGQPLQGMGVKPQDTNDAVKAGQGPFQPVSSPRTSYGVGPDEEGCHIWCVPRRAAWQPPTMAAPPVLLPPCNLGSDSLLLWRETLLVA